MPVRAVNRRVVHGGPTGGDYGEEAEACHPGRGGWGVGTARPWAGSGVMAEVGAAAALWIDSPVA